MAINRLAGILITLAVALIAGGADAARESRISATKHNLSSSGTGTTHSTTESQICVFCHTPHGSETAQPTPLWNKTLQNTSYTPYTSSSLDAASIQGASAGQPLGSSKLCLSCHDGVMALGSVRVLRGQRDLSIGGSSSIVIGGGTQVTMPPGSGTSTGFTRNLGTDLTNDHPISVTFDDTLSDRDGELRKPTMSTGSNGKVINRWGTVVGVRGQNDSYKPLLPLEPTGSSSAGQVQCTTCHDPHIRETSAAEGNIKFLRGNRFQKDQPTSSYSATNDIICLSCHDKGMQGAGGNTWAYSVHANSNVATQTYKSNAATLRDFPKNGDSGVTADLPVWKAACLNCHDTHTVSGARRLLREGVDSGITTAASGSGFGATTLGSGGFMSGTTGAALEQTCYQCHTDTTSSILNSSTTNPPNIAKDFGRTYRMRIRSADQPNGGAEVHDVGGSFNDTYNDCTTSTNKCGADLIESRTQLGSGNANNRHVECSDCHNPHRVVKFQLFYGNGGNITGAADSSASHKHTETSGYTHTNVASGALRGSWGVEPGYTCCSFHSGPTSFTVRRGDPGDGSVPNDSNADTKPYVTREYQVCLKCHSNYGYGTTPPNLDSSNAKGLTPAATGQTVATAGVANGLTKYTNQAKEFQAPTTHMGEPQNLGSDGGANASYNTNNHRSWHPVMRKTGRDLAARSITKTGGTGAATYPWRRPWLNDVGNQTMYCSDCHGSETSSNTVVPDTGNAWGPHGSANPFILKGVWNKDTGKSTQSTSGLCFKCHDYDTYARGKTFDNKGCNDNTKLNKTGFSDSNNYGVKRGDLHCYHNEKIGNLQCSWCHIAVPHGWKNKAFLVNLNDVGEEAGQAVGASKEVSLNGNGDYYTQEPYYLASKLKVASFAQSGRWIPGNCGSSNKAAGNRINSTNNNSSNDTNTGVNWMKNTCNPPSN